MQPDYRFPNNEFLFSIGHLGGVAQLGERLVRNQKVVSSILITSTIYYEALLTTQECFFFLLSPHFRPLSR